MKNEIKNFGVDNRGGEESPLTKRAALIAFYDDARQARLVEAKVAKIADEEMGIETLETQNMDSLDFHDVGVATLKAALLKAYEAGKAAR